MCIVYVYARLARAFYFCRQDSFLVCMHCHLLSNQKGWFFLLIETSGPIACQVIFSCLLVPMLRDVCVCVCVCVCYVCECFSKWERNRGWRRKEGWTELAAVNLAYDGNSMFLSNYVNVEKARIHICGWMDALFTFAFVGCSITHCLLSSSRIYLMTSSFQSAQLLLAAKGGFVPIHKSKTRQPMQNL